MSYYPYRTYKSGRDLIEVFASKKDIRARINGGPLDYVCRRTQPKEIYARLRIWAFLKGVDI